MHIHCMHHNQVCIYFFFVLLCSQIQPIIDEQQQLKANVKKMKWRRGWWWRWDRRRWNGINIDDAFLRIVGVGNELKRRWFKRMRMCKWKRTAIQSHAKGGKGERNYFNFCCWFIYWQACHIVPAIERLKKKWKKKENINFEKC